VEYSRKLEVSKKIPLKKTLCPHWLIDQHPNNKSAKNLIEYFFLQNRRCSESEIHMYRIALFA
jgi:hypothetical protein